MNKRQIVRAAKLRGWMLHPSALQGIEALLSEKSAEDDLNAILDLVSTKMHSAGTLTEDIWNEVVADLNDESESHLLSTVQQQSKNPLDDIQVVSAFRTPRLLYRPTRKQFQVEESRWPLFGEAEDKVRFKTPEKTGHSVFLLPLKLSHRDFVSDKYVRKTILPCASTCASS